MQSDLVESNPVHLTKRELAEISIRNAIESGLYKPGQVISQRQIEEDLGLSVTPIREAILVLSSNGIVERHKHHSIKVSEMHPQRLREIFMVRHMLEEEAVRLAAMHAGPDLTDRLSAINARLEEQAADPVPTAINQLDREFHKLIFRASGNQALAWTIDRVKSSFPMYALWREPGRIDTSVSEHWQLVRALEARDGDLSVAAQKLHLSKGLEATIAYLERELGPGK